MGKSETASFVLENLSLVKDQRENSNPEKEVGNPRNIILLFNWFLKNFSFLQKMKEERFWSNPGEKEIGNSKDNCRFFQRTSSYSPPLMFTFSQKDEEK